MVLYIYVMMGVINGTRSDTISSFAINVVGAAVSASAGIIVGHELSHRRDPLLKLVGQILHMKVLSGQLPIAHHEIHHKYTGIPGVDQGLCPRGKNVYQIFDFLFIKDVVNTFKHEDRRLVKRGLVTL